ncbi:gamma-glutamyltransferase [Mucor mucedo]|uniref:gamma-glutamyltransferase n=1 Tax=Mucor mucedo TaxID=29922 RepID=UPI00221EB835|nr:gamma-glutamyltransferase [Mucor mucedo]KAI7891678.1 gamma-glutamyltransferase [Mucor mucedo]
MVNNPTSKIKNLQLNGRRIIDNPISHKVTGSHGAVAVENEQCSNTGVNVLKEGGNAVDAAIASGLCIGVINSFATGKLSRFMLIRTPSGEYDFIDFREAAPAAATEDMYVHNISLSQNTGLAIAVPGEIRGYGLAHAKHGKLPWARLFRDAINIARNGFITSDHIYQRLKTSESWIMQKPEWVEIFAPNGSIAEIGSIIKRPALANTLTTIAKEGANAYYEGPIAESIVNTITKNGGILTLEDFKNYRAIERPVVNTTYNGHIVHTTSAPTSGPILLNVLNLIEPYQFSVDGPTGLNYHRLIEALKFGYAARSEFGDPSFTGNQERLDEIASKAWADSIRPQITDETTHNVSYYNPKYESNDPHGTMHLSIVDSDHGAVAQTTTINLLFGSKVMDRETGIIFNDQQADFSSPGTINAYGYSPTKNNFIAPGKRPLSSTTPTIIEDAQGQLKMVVGSSGGSHIVSGAMNVTFIEIWER